MEKIYAEHRPGGRVFQVPSNGPPFRASAGTCLSTWPAICLAFSAASSSYEAQWHEHAPTASHRGAVWAGGFLHGNHFQDFGFKRLCDRNSTRAALECL